MHLTCPLWVRRIPKIYRNNDPFYLRNLYLQFSFLFRGRSSRCFRLAEQRVIKAFQHMNAMRAVRKDRFKQLCDERIDAACAQHGIPGKMLIDGLGRMNIQLNRKMLQQLAIYEPYSFKSLTDLVKQYHSELGIVPPNAEPPAPVVTRGLLQSPIVPGNRKYYE
ncbi:hypothetical protein BOX15_Mlig015846g2 [Macrostomum lignano]|uniref:39S ribosomal protein L20, mitochondrial n=1 Tax=Macrostomum lignano TaxID=282301 RepID=A0A267GPQ0_9PLAT|nr:hypothetical protein BOX15_Mlig015846g2 [Macrostomum lignano]